MNQKTINYSANVVEHCHVSPPPGSVPETSLPVTFFDVPWLLCRHMQRVYFYRLQDHSTVHQLLLPSLRRSLSLTLQHFFPYAGNLVSPPPPEKPRIVYADGDFVSFTVAESYGDFDHLIANYPRDVRDLHPFVPDLPPARAEGPTRVAPLMALQVTIFPDKGICIGVRFCHVAADGRSFHHFMKSWSWICKTQDQMPLPIPSHDRAAIKDQNGLDLLLLKDWWALASTWDPNAGPSHDALANKVRTTIVLGQAQIENLKRWVKTQLDDNDNHIISSFVVICALMWVCLVKSEDQDNDDNIVSDNDKPCHFVFVADCRNRIEFPVSATYFGNCLSLCFVELKMKELVGEKAIVLAAKAVAKRVSELRERGYLAGVESWVSKWKSVAELGQRVITVSGSAKMGFYDADFGFGRPRWTESVQVDVSDAFALAENWDDETGGVEIGMALSSDKMPKFNFLLEQSLIGYAID